MYTRSMKSLSKKNIRELLETHFGESFQGHYPLSSILPIGIGGVGDLFVVANSVADLVYAGKIAVDNKLPYVVIGGGTATLIGESGFPGLVIKNNSSNIFKVDGSSRVVCDSGTTNSRIINHMASVGLGGIEFLDSIPGTIGGAVVSDAALGQRKISSYIKEVSLFDPESQEVVAVDSLAFRKIREQICSGQLVYPWIVLTVTLQFAQLTQEEIIRRLSIIKQSFSHSKGRSLGHIFSQKLSNLTLDRRFHQQLRALNTTYDQVTDRLSLRNSCTPQQLKASIELILRTAKDFGIETSKKITYLGYYQGEDDA